MPSPSPTASPPRAVYLNQAAESWPKAPGVIEAVEAALTLPPASPGRGAGKQADILAECRRQLAALLEISDQSRIVLTHGGTMALNLAVVGLGQERLRRVVTSAAEHNSLLRPLRHFQRRWGGEMLVLNVDGEGAISGAQWREALEQRPTLVALGHASNVTGTIQNIAPLFAQARQAGALTLLDASQTAGHIPVHPEELMADLVAFPGHKGLLGPTGTGVLFVRPGLDLEPLLVGGTGIRSDLDFQPDEMPMRLEAGTPNVPALAGLGAALGWLEANGPAVCHRAHEHMVRFLEGVRALPRVRLFGSAQAENRLGVMSFQIEGWEVEEAGYILGRSFGIHCRTGLHCAPLIHRHIGSAPNGTVRFSFSGLNDPVDVETALAALRALAP